MIDLTEAAHPAINQHYGSAAEDAIAAGHLFEGFSGEAHRFSISVVHDLRNPLAAICGCTEMLLHGELDAAQSRRALPTFNGLRPE